MREREREGEREQRAEAERTVKDDVVGPPPLETGCVSVRHSAPQ